VVVRSLAKSSVIIDITDAPDVYQKFDHRIGGYTKVLIRFDQHKVG